MESGLPEKLQNVNFATAVGLIILAVIYTCVRTINYLAYIKPQIKHKAGAGNASGGFDSREPETVYGGTAGYGEALNRIYARSGERTEMLKDIRNGVSAVSSTVHRLFTNAAIIDNAADSLIKDMEARYSGGAMPADEASGGVFPADKAADGVSPSDRASAGAIIKKILSYGLTPEADKLEALFNEVNVYLDMLDQGKRSISEKLVQSDELIRQSVTNSNRISLNAAVESAKIGEAGRGFAYLADDIRTGAEDLRAVISIIDDALDGTGAQAAIIAELEALHAEVGRVYGIEAAAGRDVGHARLTPPTIDQIVSQANAAGTHKPDYNSGVGEADPADTVNPAAGYIGIGSAELDFDEIRGRISEMRSEILTLGAALAGAFETASSEVKRMDRVLEMDADITADAYALARQYDNPDKEDII